MKLELDSYESGFLQGVIQEYVMNHKNDVNYQESIFVAKQISEKLITKVCQSFGEPDF